jgi:hypothetical protein
VFLETGRAPVTYCCTWPPQSSKHRMSGVDAWTYSSSGVHKTVRGGVPPPAVAKELPSSRQAMRSHAAEVQQLLLEVENLTRQVSPAAPSTC